jgi:hypothetical protein
MPKRALEMMAFNKKVANGKGKKATHIFFSDSDEDELPTVLKIEL